MIECAECRRRVLADPHAATPELAEHLAHCPECPGYRERLLRFEGRLARALRIQCVAEGIETQANASEIRRLGCDLGQGHYFSKALPVAEAGALLELNPAYFVG